MYTSSSRAPGLQRSRVHFRYRDSKEGRDAGANLIASVNLFQTLGHEYELHFWQIDIVHFGTSNNEDVAFQVPLAVIFLYIYKSLFI